MSVNPNFPLRKGSKSQPRRERSLRMEVLEERALLSAVPLSAQEYADLRANYADFNLAEDMDDVNIIPLDLAEGDDLTSLKAAISELTIAAISFTASSMFFPLITSTMFAWKE